MLLGERALGGGGRNRRGLGGKFLCPAVPLYSVSALTSQRALSPIPPLRLASYDLFEEAFEIYKKFNLKQQAIRVVLDHMEDLDRAHEYATKVR